MKSRTYSFVIALVAGGMFLLAGGQAQALTVAHQATLTGYDGDCQACHLPHKGAAKRGLAITPDEGSTFGWVGDFCLTRCHNQAATMPRAYVGQSVMFQIGGCDVPPSATTDGSLAGSHGMNYCNDGNNAPSSTQVASTLPYGSATNLRTATFQCTTCHDVHKNATGDVSDALLQRDPDVLCQECHLNRSNGLSATWGGGFGFAQTVGSHPVGTDITGDLNGAVSPIIFDAAFSVAYNTGTGGGNHNLGGHRTTDGATGGMSCATCHAVHGIQPDGGANQPAAAIFTEDLLAAAVTGVQGAAEPNRHATGNLETNNAFCEGCHGAATTKWNPGGTAMSHPVDAMDYANNGQGFTVADIGLVQTMNAAWPRGSATAINGIGLGATSSAPGARVICNTCHTVHPNANVNSSITGYIAANLMYTTDGVEANTIAATGTPLLRQAGSGTTNNAQICIYCHGGDSGTTKAGVAEHHPVGVQLNNQFSTTGKTITPVTGTTITAANLDPNSNGWLDCGDCHFGGQNVDATQGAAHNWVSKNAPMAATWYPSGNGNDQEIAGTYYIEGQSVMCFLCHTNATLTGAAGTFFSPTNGTTAPYAKYEDQGEGTHFLGRFAPATITSGRLAGAAFNPLTSNWGGVAGVRSRFGGTQTNPEIVCESCHELEPDKNVAKMPANRPNNPLLLYTYYENMAEDQSNFCEGCHNHNPGSTGTQVAHPMTGDTVSSTGAVLSNVIATSKANAAGAPGTYGTYAGGAAGNLKTNCESCHQVHDAPTLSGTLILDAGTGVAAAGTATPRNNTVTLYGSAAYTRSTYDLADPQMNINFTGFCAQCHNY